MSANFVQIKMRGMPVDFTLVDAADPQRLHGTVDTMDWGIVLSEWQGSCEVLLVGQRRASAVELLRAAASAVEALS